jgi:hypothetical protein
MVARQVRLKSQDGAIKPEISRKVLRFAQDDRLLRTRRCSAPNYAK